MAIRLLPKRLIGTTIRGIRTRLGQTQDEFAASLGLEDGSTVSKWENGEVQPDYPTLAKIAAMGLVDVLVFTEAGPAGETPQLTPGEANELRRLLGNMETLLAQAREIVDRAADRTAVEVLEAATGRAPARGEFEIEPTLAVHAEVAVTPRGRKSAGGGTRGSGRSGGRSGGPSGEGGSSARRSKEGGDRSSSSPGGGGSKSSGGRTRSGGGSSGGRASSDRASSGGREASSGAAGSSSGATGSSGEGSSSGSRSSRAGSSRGSRSGTGGGSSSPGSRGGRGRSGDRSASRPAE